MALSLSRFDTIARELYRRRYSDVISRTMLDQLELEFFYGPGPAYSEQEAPAAFLGLEEDVRIWIEGKLDQYAAQAAVGPPVPKDTGVQADEPGATTDMGMTDFLARQERERSASSSAGLPGWAWGAIAAALVVAGMAFGARRGARG